MWLLAKSSLALAAVGDGHWDRQFGMPGTRTWNYALRFNGGFLYTAGCSLYSGLIATNTHINIFDGTNWSMLGEITGDIPVIYDFAFIGSNMYIGGYFQEAGGTVAKGLARWDGTNWSDVGGFDGLVYTLATDGTNLYVGGSFTNAGGRSITNIAKWDGTNWLDLGGVGIYPESGLGQAVRILLWHDGKLYVGGWFTVAGGTPATNLAVWDGQGWSQIGGGVGDANGLVTAIAFLGGDLYVAGRFNKAGTVSVQNIASWDGAAWWPLGSGLIAPSGNVPVDGLAFLGTELFATGDFTNAGGVTATRVAKWDGVKWTALGGLNDVGLRAVSNSGSIYICGHFTMASNTVASRIVRWDGSGWQPVAGTARHGTHSYVYALAVGTDGLYMGGMFTAVGCTQASRIARWDGTTWHAVGSGVRAAAGVTARVLALKAVDNQIFAGGVFTEAGGVAASNIAVWDGTQWRSLGNGVNGAVNAIEVSGARVYVGGSFTNAYNGSGGPAVRVDCLAYWEPSVGWNPAGPVIGAGNVFALCVAGNVLYAGGSFTNIAGTTANRVAMCRDGVWYSLGVGGANGVNGTVYALLATEDGIYVGGAFTNAGGVTARAIAKWDGTSWSALGSGFLSSGTASVRALARSGRYIYATGAFTNAGGVITRTIARWDGSKWEALGSGLGNDYSPGAARGEALAVFGDDIFIGGIFQTAGLGNAGYIARWNDRIDFSPHSVMRLVQPACLGGTFGCRVTSNNRVTFVVERSEDMVNWTAIATNSALSLNFTDPTAGTAALRFYRTRQVP